MMHVKYLHLQQQSYNILKWCWCNYVQLLLSSFFVLLALYDFFLFSLFWCCYVFVEHWYPPCLNVIMNCNVILLFHCHNVRNTTVCLIMISMVVPTKIPCLKWCCVHLLPNECINTKEIPFWDNEMMKTLLQWC